MSDTRQLVESRTLDGATVRTGFLSREQVLIFRYDDGSVVIGYPVYTHGGAAVIVPLAEFSAARDTLTGSSDE